MDKLPSFDELSFDEETHVYRLNGREIPSVTSIMKPLSDFEYKGVQSGTLSRAANKGSAVHNAIELWIKYGVEDIPTEYSGYFDAFQQWVEHYKPDIIGSETRLYHKYLSYAGTADMTAIIDGKLTLIDYKTTYRLIDQMVSVQLEAYSRAMESHGAKFEQKAALQLKKDGTYTFHVYKMPDIEKWQVFTSLLTIWNYCHKE